ncbi:hypothetical protein RM543_15115 [Roseicyclus sp. F158]|uniref:Uncharacterized protein n=1 Tax=Tropicimonas omnivorans TaxID=3075590 RepID=A0ABU3DJX4_9RHOB|nr:hypothetical protein [Roseicyclus sp. F158]MDT0684019.1 hypothetical protein [Roseicyclus sp. F158]
MIVDAAKIATHSGRDGFCRIRHFEEPDRFGFPQLLADFDRRHRRKALLDDGLTRFSDTSPHLGPDDSLLCLAFTDLVPALPLGRRWIALDHACATHRLPMIATILEPRDGLAGSLLRIAKDPRNQRSSETYVEALGALGLLCGADTVDLLSDTVCPIDATPELLRKVSADADDLVLLARTGRAAPVILFLTGS